MVFGDVTDLEQPAHHLAKDLLTCANSETSNGAVLDALFLAV